MCFMCRYFYEIFTLHAEECGVIAKNEVTRIMLATIFVGLIGGFSLKRWGLVEKLLKVYYKKNSQLSFDIDINFETFGYFACLSLGFLGGYFAGACFGCFSWRNSYYIGYLFGMGY